MRIWSRRRCGLPPVRFGVISRHLSFVAPFRGSPLREVRCAERCQLLRRRDERCQLLRRHNEFSGSGRSVRVGTCRHPSWNLKLSGLSQCKVLAQASCSSRRFIKRFVILLATRCPCQESVAMWLQAMSTVVIGSWISVFRKRALLTTAIPPPLTAEREVRRLRRRCCLPVNPRLQTPERAR